MRMTEPMTTPVGDQPPPPAPEQLPEPKEAEQRDEPAPSEGAEK